MTVEALCQDCLRINRLGNAAAAATHLCVCGGSVCCCPTCINAIIDLRAGRLDSPHFLAPVKAWTETEGIHDPTPEEM